MTATVWVSQWQQQCCGEPFAVGSLVTWPISPAGVAGLEQLIGDERAGSVAGAEDHHDTLPDRVPITGRIVEISAVLSRMEQVPGAPRTPPALRAVTGSAVEVHVHASSDRPRAPAGTWLEGYLVRLDVEAPSP